MSPSAVTDSFSNDASDDSNKHLEIQPSKCDVLIVGAGPSGLMLAQALGRLGINVRVIERRIHGSQYGNADGLQPRTLEIWKSYGILEDIQKKGACMRAMVTYQANPDGEGLLRSRPAINVVVPCRYQYEITASITDIEGTLRSKADEFGVRITQPSFPTSLELFDEMKTSITANMHPIKVTVQRSGTPVLSCHCAEIGANRQTDLCSCSGVNQKSPRTEVIDAKFVVGADGAGSWVRRSLGIEMEGEQTEDVWGVVDVVLETDFPDYRFKCVIQAASGAIIIIPREGEKIRIYVQLSAADSIPRYADGRLQRSALQEEEILDKILLRIREGFSPFKITFAHVFWHTIFSTAQKVAAKFSYRNRVFIVGDACHTHSPKAGQGANASMGDSHNLAWKLAYVLKGWAHPSILRTYEMERRAYALDLIYFDREISQSLEGGPAAEYQRLLHKQNMFTSGMGISYTSPLIVESSKRYGFIVPGERVLPSPITCLGDWADVDIHDLLISDGLFKVLVFPGDILLAPVKSNMDNFARVIDEGISKRQPNRSPSRIQFYTILRNNKEDVIWTDVPRSLAPSWRNCFVVRANEDIYQNFGFSDADDGVFILVRPDGYVSMVCDMGAENGREISSFVYNRL